MAQIKISNYEVDKENMKVYLLWALFTLAACNFVELTTFGTGPTITKAEIVGGRILLTGNNLTSVTKVTPQGTTLAGYTMKIEEQTSSALTIKLVHASSATMNLALGTLLNFVISSASADTTVNLTVTAAVPTGAVMSFNLASCPSGWSPLDGTGGRADARGRMVIGAGTGTGLTARALASTGGTETHTLTTPQIPSHSHTALMRAFADTALSTDPTLAYFGISSGANVYSADTPDVTMAADAITVSAVGGGQPHPIMNPYVAFLYCQKD